MERVLRIKRGLTVYRKCSDTGTSERISAHIQNIEVVHTNIDDDNNDDDNMLTQFPEPSEEFDEFQLPNHERCATRTLHLNSFKRYG